MAVKVLESNINKEHHKVEGGKEKEKEKDKGKEADEVKDMSALVHPPEMPIVIDEAALEDILGVGFDFSLL